MEIEKKGKQVETELEKAFEEAKGTEESKGNFIDKAKNLL